MVGSISNVFADPFLTQFQAKTTECNQLMVSDVLTQEIKTITRQITEKIETLRNDQNFKTTERNRHTDKNIGTLNELWDIIS